jgi:hypothetical protein
MKKAPSQLLSYVALGTSAGISELEAKEETEIF